MCGPCAVNKECLHAQDKLLAGAKETPMHLMRPPLRRGCELGEVDPVVGEGDGVEMPIQTEVRVRCLKANLAKSLLWRI